jgi:hypothetical protein
VADDPLNKIPVDPPIPPDGIDDGIPDLSEDLETYQWRVRFLELEKQEHELTVERSMLTQRRRYALLLFGVILVWLAFIAVVVFLSGAGSHPNVRIHIWFFRIHLPTATFKLSDSVLIALISTTTINVLGLFYIVARWLFPSKNNEKPAQKEK